MYKVQTLHQSKSHKVIKFSVRNLAQTSQQKTTHQKHPPTRPLLNAQQTDVPHSQLSQPRSKVTTRVKYLGHLGGLLVSAIAGYKKKPSCNFIILSGFITNQLSLSNQSFKQSVKHYLLAAVTLA